MAQYLDIPGIKGESTHDQNTNWNEKIQVQNFNYDVAQKASLQTGTGLVAGGASLSHISFVKAMDKSTPFLFYKLCSGEPIEKCYFRISRAGGQEGVYEYMTIECNKVLVSQYSTSGSRGDGNLPMESISFSVGSITENYDDRDESGARVANVKAGFDFMKNTSSIG